MMRSIMKNWQDNNMSYYTGVITAEYDTELSRLIRQSAIYDE